MLLLGPLVVQRPEQQQPGGRGGVRGGVDVRDQAVAQLVGRAEELGVRVDPDPRLTVRAVNPEHLADGETGQRSSDQGIAVLNRSKPC